MTFVLLNDIAGELLPYAIDAGFRPGSRGPFGSAKGPKTIDAPPGHIRVGGRKPREGGQLAVLKQAPPRDESVRPGVRVEGVEQCEEYGPQGIPYGVAASTGMIKNKKPMEIICNHYKK